MALLLVSWPENSVHMRVVLTVSPQLPSEGPFSASCWFWWVPFSLTFVSLKKDFIYSTERDTAREGTPAGGVGGREAGTPLSREPDAGLHPRTLGSRPELKADAQ